MESNHYFSYQKKEDGICILRCYANESRITIPDQIEGMPVTEIAPYAFATEMEDEPSNPGSMPCICGERLEELELPASIARVGKYVFYNCRNFHSFSFFSKIESMGAGAFTGCKRLNRLTVQEALEPTACLREVLTDLNQTVEVFWEGEQKCAALYPAFFEEAVENTPARIIETHTHGVGIQYRNAFLHGKVDWREYDGLFGVGKHHMETSEAIRMATYRLMAPVQLGEGAREAYGTFLRGHLEEAAGLFLKNGERIPLCWLAEQFVGDKREYADILGAAKADAAGASILMNIYHRRFPEQEKRGFSL